MTASQRLRLVWIGLLFATGGILVLALLPPFLPAEGQLLVRQCFSGVCHQLPARSPHLYGVPLAICDRCTGIYLGLVLGVLGTGWGRRQNSVHEEWGQYLLLGSLLPLGVDWIGPLLGLWDNGPISRALTGLLFGIVAASYITDHLLRRFGRPSVEGP